MWNAIKLLFEAIGKVLGRNVGRAVSFALSASIVAGLLAVWYVMSLMDDLPNIEHADEIELNVPLRIFTSDGLLIGEFGNERRIPVNIQDTPSILHDAILSAEDDGFYTHSGVDFKAILRAVLSNFKSGGKGQGASTITMQVARNFFLSNDKTYRRKIREVLLAFKMERTLSKEQILELYINKIFLGHRSYGFAAAAQTYYGRDLKDLNLPELAMLAGLPKAPSAYNPVRNAKRATIRRNYVLDRMHDLQLIDDLSHEFAVKAPLSASLHIAELDMQAPYITEMARQYMVNHFGEASYESGYNVTLTVPSTYQLSARKALRKGLMDYDLRHGYRGPAGHINLNQTSLNEDEESLATQLLHDIPNSQELKAALVTQVSKRSLSATLADNTDIAIKWDGLKWAAKYKSASSKGAAPKSVSSIAKVGDIIYAIESTDKDKSSWRLSQIPNVSGALVTLDPHTGAILSMVGGFDYYLSKFNRAAQARRQLGSNIKPFIYAAALEQGLTPASQVSGEPIVIESAQEGVWRPENYEKKFFGPTRLRLALSKSLNLVSIRLLRAVGVDNARNFLEGFGFNKEILPKNLSLALGSASVTPLQVASAYATLASGGQKTRPYLIQSITDREGNYISKFETSCDICTVLDEAVRPFGQIENFDPNQPAISPESQYLITHMMKSVITAGTGRKALALERNDLSGKTGTTNDYRDAWFSGFNPDVVTSVWLGFDQPQFLGRRESGGGAALPIWIDHMRTVFKDYPQRNYPQPRGVTTAYIDRDSSARTSPDDINGYLEVFKIGTEPNITAVSSQPGSATDTSEDLF